MPEINGRRIGKFKISGELLMGIRDYDNEAYVTMQLLMSKIIVLRTEDNYWDGTIEYTALSKEFDPSPIGEAVPYYLIKINSSSITFTKVPI